MDADEARPPRVFISYAHDNAEHVEAVRQLWVLLRQNGIDATIDLPAANRVDWPIWMREHLEEADFVLVIGSPAYRSRAEGSGEPAFGRGVRSESAHIRDMLYRDARAIRRVVPVLLPGYTVDDLPLWVSPRSNSNYRVQDFSALGIESLLRMILNQPRQVEPPLGDAPNLPQSHNSPAGRGLESGHRSPPDHGAGDSRPRAVLITSHGDLDSAEELAGALAVLRSEGVIASIGVREVASSFTREPVEIDERVKVADIVLLLVSRDFINTEYGTTAELRMLLADESRTVFPVIVRATSWKQQPYGGLAPLPTGGSPVADWRSRDAAMADIVDAVRLAAASVRAIVERNPFGGIPPQRSQELGEVFKLNGVPTSTFVEPDEFTEFRLALAQPGLGVILEGPSGVGKTTLLRHAVKQLAAQHDDPRLLSARRPKDVTAIRELLNGHRGIAVVDDFHRLPADLQEQVADYLKFLADDDASEGKLVIVGIPGTAKSLVSVGFDLATRIRVFQLGAVSRELVVAMVEKGEAALNIRLADKSSIAVSAAGSLLTAQMLCWNVAALAGIERTAPKLVTVQPDLRLARRKVAEQLDLKYHAMVERFIMLDGSAETVCIDLLLRLSQTDDGILPLATLVSEQPDLSAQVERNFVQKHASGFGPDQGPITDHMYYDAPRRRIIADDPQLLFYLRELHRDELVSLAGKTLPKVRDQVFACYSRKDSVWLERLQVHLGPLQRRGILDFWSDTRIETGDIWRDEIGQALDRSRIAILLVSADFLDSDFINEVELPALLQAAEDGGCQILPLLVAPSAYMDMPSLSKFQPFNRDGRTMLELDPASREKLFARMAQTLLKRFQGQL